MDDFFAAEPRAHSPSTTSVDDVDARRAQAAKELAVSMFYDDPSSFIDHSGLIEWLERHDETLFMRWLRLKHGFLDQCVWYPIGLVEHGYSSPETRRDHRVTTMYTDLDITAKGSVLDVIAFMTSRATQIRFESNHVAFDRRAHRLMSMTPHRCCEIIGHSVVELDHGASRFEDSEPMFVRHEQDIVEMLPRFPHQFVEVDTSRAIRGMLPDFIVDELL